MAGAAASLDAGWPGLYDRVVQEDGTLEWATFWSFLAAGVSFVTSALRLPWRQRWFPLWLGLFCVLVDDDLRQNGFLGVCLGHGVGLALAARSRFAAALLRPGCGEACVASRISP